MYVLTLSRDLACLVCLLPPSILSVCNILHHFKPSTIISSFAETGLILYNPEKVLAPLREKMQKKMPAPVSTPSPTSSFTTASTVTIIAFQPRVRRVPHTDPLSCRYYELVREPPLPSS